MKHGAATWWIAMVLIGASCGAPKDSGVARNALGEGSQNWRLLYAFPNQRVFHATVYDRARQRVVVFGGDATSDTWELNGSTTAWRRVASVGPSPRAGLAMAYDRDRDRTILFGGSTGSDETWEWNGNTRTWTQIFPMGGVKPTGRRDHAMAYDSIRKRIVLHGGSTGANETWTYDGATSAWTLAVTGGAPATQKHGMTWDDARGVVLLYGGSAGRVTYEWNGSSWSNVATGTGPPFASDFGIAYDEGRQRTYTFGGITMGAVRDVWEWNGATATWTNVTTDGPQGRHARGAMTYDASRGRIVLYCGANFGVYYNEVWEWDAFSYQWSLVGQPLGPSARVGSAMVFDVARNRILLTGGQTPGGPIVSDTMWQWTPQAQWTTAPGSLATAYHGLAGYLSSGSAVFFTPVAFGGTSGATTTGFYDAVTGWFNSAMAAPSARSQLAMAADAAGYQVIFGGSSGGSETWHYLSGSGGWALATTSGPSARQGHSMVYDSTRDRFVMFGGSAGGNETWEYQRATTTWSMVASTGPSARQGHSMIYNKPRQRTVLFGGSTGSDETWEFDGATATWTQHFPEDHPLSAVGHAMAFDASRRITLLFGGTAGIESWVYESRGESCASGTTCETGYCADGVCCEQLFCGTCQRCDVSGAEGRCMPISGADPDTCTGGKSCVTKTLGQVTLSVCGFPNASPCASHNDCHSGFCIDGVCCDTGCGEACQRCDLPGAEGFCTATPLAAQSSGRAGACGPYLCGGAIPFCPVTCTRDDFCAPGFYCNASGACVAQKLTANACDVSAGGDCLVNDCRACSSGHCVDGVCCDSTCNGACEVCALSLGATTAGVCAPAAAGTTGRGACGAFLCGGSANCPTQCDENSDCVDGGINSYCIEGSCRGVLPNGASCQQASQCNSARCVDGRCCNSDCTGECVACDELGLEGTCAFTPTPRSGDCKGEGVCDGTCAGPVGSAHCVYPGAEMKCGLCLACAADGTCSALPVGGDDACLSVDCAALTAAECWHYESTATVSCSAPGLCTTAQEACAIVVEEDGASCSIGSCVSGTCTQPQVRVTGCSYGESQPTRNLPWLVLLWAFFVATTRRRYSMNAVK